MNLPEPMFLEGTRGRLFATYFPPEGTAQGCMLFLPPFAEEMNRCRVAVASQTRQLSQLGWGVMLLDPFGTGDSEGDFSEISWAQWRADALSAVDWLRKRAGPRIGLWGFRLGALLAVDLANASPGTYERLLLWQPVLDGKLHLTQYLRLRVASLMDRGLPPETTESMREQLRHGDTVEVAGYRIGAAIASELDTIKMSDMTALSNIRIDWLEHVTEADKPLSPPSQKAIDRLRGQGCAINVQSFIGAPVWQLHDRDEVPDLIEQSTRLFGVAA